jgi:hypothetical protein
MTMAMNHRAMIRYQTVQEARPHDRLCRVRKPSAMRLRCFHPDVRKRDPLAKQELNGGGRQEGE